MRIERELTQPHSSGAFIRLLESINFEKLNTQDAKKISESSTTLPNNDNPSGFVDQTKANTTSNALEIEPIEFAAPIQTSKNNPVKQSENLYSFTSTNRKKIEGTPSLPENENKDSDSTVKKATDGKEKRCSIM